MKVYKSKTRWPKKGPSSVTSSEWIPPYSLCPVGSTKTHGVVLLSRASMGGVLTSDNIWHGTRFLTTFSVFLTFSLSGWLHTEAIGSFAVLNGPRPTTNPLYCSNGEILMYRSFPVTLTSDIRSYPNKLLALSHGGGDDCSTTWFPKLVCQSEPPDLPW